MLLNKKIKTFAIISHPDAGKTTFTEQLLLLSGKINTAGTVKARKADKHVTSDWMELEKQRGISVSTSVMKLYFDDFEVNLLDTPGHGDFSEDTYRTLTAVDSAIMIIDSAKGVEDRTIKLMEVCRLRKIPIITFINKLDRDGKDPFDLLDNIEKILQLDCIPYNWPVGMGKNFKGVYNLYQKNFSSYKDSISAQLSLQNPELVDYLAGDYQELLDNIEMIDGATKEFTQSDYLSGNITPVFFGSAINSFGIQEMLTEFLQIAPMPQSRIAITRAVAPDEDKFTGFVFKIQANMDPKHHDRLAFMRIVSGKFTKGMKLLHTKTGKHINVTKALNLFAQERTEIEVAYPGDIIGIHNYGNISIGDTFTTGEQLQFLGIPSFAPELFRVVRLNNPLKQKALLKGLLQLSEEGATQVFRPLASNDLILGAVGVLQFDVVAHRLKHEYGVDCKYENSSIVTARWVECKDAAEEQDFKSRLLNNLAIDGAERLIYLAPNRAHLSLTIDRWPDVKFLDTKEHAST